MAQVEWLGTARPILSHKGAVHETISMGRSADEMYPRCGQCYPCTVPECTVPECTVL